MILISEDTLNEAGPILVGIIGGILIAWGIRYLLTKTGRSRFLDGSWFYVAIGALVFVAHGLFAIWAIQGDESALYMIIGLFYFWTLLALVNGHGWHRSLAGWREAQDGWKVSNLAVEDCQRLLTEALTDLETWDREKAQDIAQRWYTVTMLRYRSLEETEVDE